MKEKQCSLESFKVDNEVFRPKDLEEELLRPVVTGKLKEIEFEDLNLIRKIYI